MSLFASAGLCVPETTLSADRSASRVIVDGARKLASHKRACGNEVPDQSLIGRWEKGPNREGLAIPITKWFSHFNH